MSFTAVTPTPNTRLVWTYGVIRSGGNHVFPVMLSLSAANKQIMLKRNIARKMQETGLLRWSTPQSAPGPIFPDPGRGCKLQSSAGIKI